ncbi:MAG: aldo/keto reductase [Thermomicrobiales bacterium]
MTNGILARKPLGTTGISVPPIAVGCAPLGNMPDTFGYAVSEEEAVATVLRALKGPLDYIDTSAEYGNGESERRVGLAYRQLGGRPASSVLQTKIGMGPDGDFSGDAIKRRFERSLELLGVDSIEIVFLHDPELISFAEGMAPGGPVEVLQQFKEQGAIGVLGVAGGPIDVERQYVETGIFDVLITHNRYTLLNRVADPLLTLAKDRGLAVMNAAPYGSGILAKGASAYPRYAYQEAPDVMVERTREFEAICARHDIPLGAAALQFSMRDPRIDVTIVGMSKPDRIDQTIALAEVEIPDAAWEEILAIPFDMGEPEANRDMSGYGK